MGAEMCIRDRSRLMTDMLDTGEAVEEKPIEDLASKLAALDLDEAVLYSPDLLAKHMQRREKEMRRLSKELQFEDAARVRDELQILKEVLHS